MTTRLKTGLPLDSTSTNDNSHNWNGIGQDCLGEGGHALDAHFLAWFTNVNKIFNKSCNLESAGDLRHNGN
jgi:hypothetical protein